MVQPLLHSIVCFSLAFHFVNKVNYILLKSLFIKESLLGLFVFLELIDFLFVIVIFNKLRKKNVDDSRIETFKTFKVVYYIISLIISRIAMTLASIKDLVSNQILV
jgi:hypothetical protein